MIVDWKKIKKEYIGSNGKVILKDLADKHGAKIGTLRSRKSRENWDDEISNATQRDKNVATQNKAKEINKNNKKTSEETIVEEVIENKTLTDEQQLFCVYYIKCFNATKAYQKAYGCSYESANSHGYKLLSNVVIKEQILRLKQNRFNRAMLNEDDIFQKYMDIAFTDISDFVEFGTEELPKLDVNTGKQALDEEGNPLFYTRNYVYFKNSAEVDGTLLSEVKQGKDGVSVKLQDKMKALQWLSDRMDLLTTYNKEKLQLEKDKLEHLKGKDNQTDKPIEIVIKKKEDER